MCLVLRGAMLRCKCCKIGAKTTAQADELPLCSCPARIRASGGMPAIEPVQPPLLPGVGPAPWAPRANSRGGPLGSSGSAGSSAREGPPPADAPARGGLGDGSGS
eukprot:5890512-Pyramimonas_sp.AAC.1